VDEVGDPEQQRNHKNDGGEAAAPVGRGAHGLDARGCAGYRRLKREPDQDAREHRLEQAEHRKIGNEVARELQVNAERLFEVAG
jgi:hypothetical protein